VYAKLDTFFRNPYTTLPSISVSGAGGTESTTVERERVEIQRSLDAWKKQVDTGIPDALLETRITEAQQALARMQTFAGSVGVLVSRQNTSGISGDTKATQEATALAGRSTIDSARTLLVQAQEGITNAKGGSALATLNEEKVRTGDRPEDIAVYRAQVTQAEGALAGALAQLEKKRIRSPISGTVSSLTVSQGDFVPAYTVVAVITNDTGLEIETSVSETVLPRIQVGMVLAINTHATGTVTSVATGLDPSTKKARVTVSVPENAGFVEGSFISLTIPEDALAQKNTPSDSDTLAVPILAIKVLPEGLALLTVDEQGILHTLPVQEGAIVGERMLLRETLDPNTKIVVDARGLTPETKVNIQ
jgi:HlyD family secretion protein